MDRIIVINKLGEYRMQIKLEKDSYWDNNSTFKEL